MSVVSIISNEPEFEGSRDRARLGVNSLFCIVDSVITSWYIYYIISMSTYINTLMYIAPSRPEPNHSAARCDPMGTASHAAAKSAAGVEAVGAGVASSTRGLVTASARATMVAFSASSPSCSASPQPPPPPPLLLVVPPKRRIPAPGTRPAARRECWAPPAATKRKRPRPRWVRGSRAAVPVEGAAAAPSAGAWSPARRHPLLQLPLCRSAHPWQRCWWCW